jgi:pyruvate dehydrogenase E1 component alpha subunit
MLDRGLERPRGADGLDRERALGGGHRASLAPPALDSKRETLFHFSLRMTSFAADPSGLRRVIGDGAGVPDLPPTGLEPEELLRLHRSLVLLRTYDERSVVYHRQGRIGTYAIFWGHEAVQAGAVHALEERDWVFPSYRESAIGLLRGIPASTILSWWRGHPEGWWSPAEHRVASICVPIATQVPHAAGLAWGLRMRGEDTAALVFFGDGATSEGAFHEGANFAGVMKAPLVLVCNNNQWAISTPVTEQTAAATLADKALGYGIPAVRVDGTDVLAVHSAVSEGVARARAGEGPTFVEAVSYRAAPHATADDPSAYIDSDRVEAARRDECIGRYEAYLRRLGLLDDAAAAAVREDAIAVMREGIALAEAEPPPDMSLVFEHAYASPPAFVARDLAELRRVHGA